MADKVADNVRSDDGLVHAWVQVGDLRWSHCNFVEMLSDPWQERQRVVSTDKHITCLICAVNT